MDKEDEGEGVAGSSSRQPVLQQGDPLPEMGTRAEDTSVGESLGQDLGPLMRK